MYCVYKHLFPNGKMYFGITSQSLNKRWQNGHGYNEDHQLLMYRAINKYGWDNIEHYVMNENLTYAEAKELEKYYVSKYDTNNPQHGYNMTPGGDSRVGKPVLYDGKRYQSLECFCSENNMSLKTIGDWLNGHTPMDPVFFDKGLRYENQTAQIVRGKPFRKKIICDGKTYNSLREFCRINNINSGSVSNWLNGKKGMPLKWYEKGLRFEGQDLSEIKLAVKS